MQETTDKFDTDLTNEWGTLQCLRCIVDVYIDGNGHQQVHE